jgi:hypothetical protein
MQCPQSANTDQLVVQHVMSECMRLGKEHSCCMFHPLWDKEWDREESDICEGNVDVFRACSAVQL